MLIPPEKRSKSSKQVVVFFRHLAYFLFSRADQKMMSAADEESPGEASAAVEKAVATAAAATATATATAAEGENGALVENGTKNGEGASGEREKGGGEGGDAQQG